METPQAQSGPAVQVEVQEWRDKMLPQPNRNMGTSWKPAIITGFLAIVVLCPRSAWADIQTGKYGKAQVFDCDRTPVLPLANQSFNARNFLPPVDTSSGFAYITLNPGEYVQFVQISASPCSHAIDLFNASGVKLKRLQAGGGIYGLDAVGFLHVSDPGNYGTFIANSTGYAIGGQVTYTPTIGLATCVQTAAYSPNPLPVDTPAATIPTVSEWGMISLFGFLALIAAKKLRRQQDLVT